MSHLTHLKTTIKNPVVLERVLLDMIANGLNGILAGARINRSATVTDYYGNSITADFAIQRPGKYDFGLVLNKDGEYEFVADSDACGQREFMEKLLPWYARENAIANLAALGFEIESIQPADENGQVKIIAGKWS